LHAKDRLQIIYKDIPDRLFHTRSFCLVRSLLCNYFVELAGVYGEEEVQQREVGMQLKNETLIPRCGRINLLKIFTGRGRILR